MPVAQAQWILWIPWMGVNHRRREVGDLPPSPMRREQLSGGFQIRVSIVSIVSIISIK
jgi:hypothetical protein